jgi:superfamily II DNA or RNA helicase
MKLRGFQQILDAEIVTAWGQGYRNVIPLLPTGGGKTMLMAHRFKNHDGPSCAIAHRQELVGQIATALTRCGVPHRIIAPEKTIRSIVALEIAETGNTLYNPSAQCAVAGVNTLVRRTPDTWMQRVTLLAQDEGHHVLAANIWGKTAQKFTNPNLCGMFPTATPSRADGKGLGRSSHGLADKLIIGPNGRDLINQGYLTDYKIISVPSDVDISEVHIANDGDLNRFELAKAVHASRTIVGDVVETYLKFAPGKIGVTFAVDIAAATEIAAAYRKAGIPAEVITGDTDILVRAALLRKLRNRELLQLVNVDLFGEGFDLPALEVVTMVRHTESFGFFSQCFGRMLRLFITPELNNRWDDFTASERLWHISQSAKPVGMLIDHVGNVVRFASTFGLPDRPKIAWTLEPRERRSRTSVLTVDSLRNCLNPTCMRLYERFLIACPYCRTPIPPPAERSSPEQVDGDLSLLSAEALKSMCGEVVIIDGAPRIPNNVAPEVEGAIRRRHFERQNAQATLRNTIAIWGGYQKHLGFSDQESWRRFFLSFGIDILSAQALGAPAAIDLTTAINSRLAIDGVGNKV